jgi:hypothetical protein
MATVSFGKRIGDGTTEAVERLNRTAAAQSLSTSLEEVERALEKLDEGTYGVCDDCGSRSHPSAWRRSRGPRSVSATRRRGPRLGLTVRPPF